MSKTLFWYILKDLLKVFLMTSGVLAGIMSFGGLLKPLMQFGLSASQVGKMLACFLPATQTYSLPIAALFATTVVYGRLASDNEITACRASGISYTSLTAPALVLGLILSLISLVCVSFVVPHYMLKVEKVAFDSLADVVQKSIQRSHQIRLEKKYVIYAESAQILPPSPDAPNDEAVALYGPMFCTMVWNENLRTNIPSEFYTARSATVVIRRNKDDVQFIAKLEDGSMFPRQLQGASIGGIGTAEFGPISVSSPIRENTKFMNIAQLKELYHDPTRSREMRRRHASVTRDEQQGAFLNAIAAALKSTGQFRFVGDEQTFAVLIEPGVKLLPHSSSNKLAMVCPETGPRRIRLQRSRDDQVMATDEARQLAIRVTADNDNDFLQLRFQLEDALVASADGQAPKISVSRSLSVRMPPELAALKDRPLQYYLTKGPTHNNDLKDIRKKLPGLQAGIVAEIHSRASFAVSCLILVMIGCALGMMFRTGNYLSAFALSVVPALLCITLAITGQHVCENEPNLMKLGLSIVWSGNALVLILVITLLLHLRRQ